jgi:RNA polymerase sigma-70 factor (ECF subfamily)
MALSETIIVRVLLAERAKLLAYIWVIVRDAHLVEDVFQEVAALAVQKRNELRDEAALPVWLRRTARFQALAALRDKARDPHQSLTPEILDQLDTYWSSQDRQPDDARVEALQDCLTQLSPYARQIVALRYGKGLQGIKVAEALGRNVRTIYMALTRIHNSLRDCIEQKLAVPGDSHA